MLLSDFLFNFIFFKTSLMLSVPELIWPHQSSVWHARREMQG